MQTAILDFLNTDFVSLARAKSTWAPTFDQRLGSRGLAVYILEDITTDVNHRLSVTTYNR